MTHWRHPGWVRLLVLLGVALLIRGQTFGHPLLHIDENFYLLVGDRMVRDGAWPYVDIWDRKPVGLFVLFAAFRLLGGDGFLISQLAALAAAVGTAWIIVRLAERAVAPGAAMAGGIAYLAGLTFFGGYGAQAPVFFNLLMAAAALVLVRTLDRADGDKTLLRGGIVCMLLVGLAMQIKYSVVVEGVFFGLVLLFAARHQGWARLVLWGFLWIAAALVPTVVAWLVYKVAGHQEAFLFANFISIFQRDSAFDAVTKKRILSMLGLMSPFLLLSLFAWRGRTLAIARFALGWLGFAFVGLVILGTFYNHYGLPLLLPLSLTLAIGVGFADWRPWITASITALLLLAGMIGTSVKIGRKADAADLAHILTYVSRDAPNCPWFLGTTGPSLYIRSGACLPSRYALSGHLFERHERHAIGVDQNAEIEAVLAQRPALITLDQTPNTEEKPAQRARFLKMLKADYKLAEIRETGGSNVMIYVRTSRR